jgi:hypothetical protein
MDVARRREGGKAQTGRPGRLVDGPAPDGEVAVRDPAGFESRLGLCRGQPTVELAWAEEDLAGTGGCGKREICWTSEDESRLGPGGVERETQKVVVLRNANVRKAIVVAVGEGSRPRDRGGWSVRETDILLTRASDRRKRQLGENF